MRNLKRVLSLALAVMMLIGMMVVGANAAGINDFTDKDEIVNKDAVAMLTTLGVINGKEDGSFYAPKDNVTRAEMAKMIATILNQGADVNDLYANLNTGLKDIDNSWAKGYINYCYSLGIIAGRGDGRFDPTAPVTGNEAAKMLLVAIGYDPAIEGLTGSTWAIKTTALASTLGIFDGMNAPTQENLNRDNAALLIYNAVDVEMIQKYEDGYAVTFDDSRTLLSNKYGVYKVEGVVTANEWAQLQETDSDAALRTGKTTLEDVIVYSSTTSNTTVAEGVRETNPVTFSVSTPVNYLGKTVTMYIEKTTILANSKVLGVSVKDSVNVIQATTATEETLADYLKGTGVSVNNGTEYYVNYGFCEDGAEEAVEIINEHPNRDLGQNNEYFNVNGVSVEVIDNNDDGTAEYVLYVQETLSEVSRYNDKNEILTFYVPERVNGALTGDAVTLSRDFEDVVFNDEVTTDDLILYVEYGGRTYVSLAPIETGVMTRVDRDKDNEMYITVNGETYKQSFIPDAASMSDVDLTHFDIDDARDDDMVGFDTEYDFILDSTGKYVVAVRPAEEVVTNYALVLGSAWTQNALEKSGQVKILKADGTEGTYYINWSKSDDAFAGVTHIQGVVANGTAEEKMELYLGSRDVHNNAGNYNVNAARGSVITYTLSDDDELTIESVLQGNTFDNNGASIEIDDQTNVRTTAGVGDNGVIMYLGYNYPAIGQVQYDLEFAYENGDGNIVVDKRDAAYQGDPKNYAVDLNTVGFYYDVVEAIDLQQGGKYFGTSYEAGDVVYGVATGWDDMCDVAAGTAAQVYPVLEKTTNRTYKATNLADLILFESDVDTDTSDYMLVLNANAATKDTWELNVVFEDGSVAAIQVDDDDLGSFNPENNNHFMQAWTYSKNSDGTYNVGRMAIDKGTAVLLKTGTVDFTDADGVKTLASDYIALSGKANVWDVTDVDDANDSTVAGAFSKTRVNTVLIIENGAIRTAWTWDIPQTVDPGVDFDTDTVLVDVNVSENPNVITITYTGDQPSAASVRSLIETNLLAHYSNTTNGEAKKVEITRFNEAGQDLTVQITMSANSGVRTAAWTYVLKNYDADSVFTPGVGGAADKIGDYELEGNWSVNGNTVTATFDKKYSVAGEHSFITNDVSRFLGALHTQSGAAEITYNGVRYVWDNNALNAAGNPVKGSRWYDAADAGYNGTAGQQNTLVSAIFGGINGWAFPQNDIVLYVDGVKMVIQLNATAA